MLTDHGHENAEEERLEDVESVCDRGVLQVAHQPLQERDFFIDKLLVRIHFIVVMIGWTGLAPWEFEFPFPGSLTSTIPCNTVPETRSGAAVERTWHISVSQDQILASALR